MSENSAVRIMSMALSDKETVQGLLEGDDRAWAAMREWVGIVLNARAFGQALRADREDITQHVLMKVLTNLRANKFDGRSSIKTYVYEITKNTCIDYMRGKYRDKQVEDLDSVAGDPLPDPGASPYTSLLRVEQQQRLAAAMRRAPESCRRLWLMIFQEKRGYREIAGLLNTTEGAIKQNVHRCNQRLMQLIRPGGTRHKSV